MPKSLAELQEEARALGRPFNRPETRPRRGYKDAAYDSAASWDEHGNFVQPWVPQEPPPIPEAKAGEEACNGQPLWAMKRYATWASRRSMFDFQKAQARIARGETQPHPRLNLDGTPYTEDDEQELQFWREKIKEAAERKAQGLVDPWDEPMNSSDEEHIAVCHGGRYKGPVGKIHPDGFLYVVEQEGAEDDDQPADQDEDQAEEEANWFKPRTPARPSTRRSTAQGRARRARSTSPGRQRTVSSRSSASSAGSRPCRQSACPGQKQMPGIRESLAPQSSVAVSQQPQTPPNSQRRKAKQASKKQSSEEGTNTESKGSTSHAVRRQSVSSQPAEQQANAEGVPRNKEVLHETRQMEPAGSKSEGFAKDPLVSPRQQARGDLKSPPSKRSPRDWLSAMLERTELRHPVDLAESPEVCRRPLDLPCAPGTPLDGPSAPATPPEAPPSKRPKNAYQLFAAEEKVTCVRRSSLAYSTHSSDEASSRRKSMGALWKELPPAVRKSYMEQAAQLKQEFLAKQAADRAARQAADQRRRQSECAEPSPSKGSPHCRTPVKESVPQSSDKAEASPDQMSDHPLAKLLRSPRLQLPKVPTLAEQAPKTPSPPKKRPRNTRSPGRKSHAGSRDERKLEAVGRSPRAVRRRVSMKAPPYSIWRVWPTRRRIRFKSPPTEEWRAYEAARLSRTLASATQEVPKTTKNAVAVKGLSSSQKASEGKRKREQKSKEQKGVTIKPTSGSLSEICGLSGDPVRAGEVKEKAKSVRSRTRRHI